MPVDPVSYAIVGLVGAIVVPLYIGYSARFYTFLKTQYYQYCKRHIRVMKGDNTIAFLGLTRLIDSFSSQFESNRYSITYKINNKNVILTTIMPYTMIKLDMGDGVMLEIEAITDDGTTVSGYELWFSNEHDTVNTVHGIINRLFEGMEISNSSDTFKVTDPQPPLPEDGNADEGVGEDDPLLIEVDDTDKKNE